jgi:hypothetical protein
LVDLPLLTIEPETAMTQLAQHLGFQEMKLESDEFNRRFALKCSEQQRVSALLNPQAIQVMLDAPNMIWQMGGRHIVLFQHGEMTASFAAIAMDALMAFAACIPGFVQEDHFASRPQL